MLKVKTFVKANDSTIGLHSGQFYEVIAIVSSDKTASGTTVVIDDGKCITGYDANCFENFGKANG